MIKERIKNDGADKAQGVEVAPGFTIEEMKAVFFDEHALRLPPYRVYRLDSEGYRYYYRFEEGGEAVFYPSVTTLLRKVMPTSPQLIDWMLDNGKEQALEKRDLAAYYGTLMHMEFEKLIISRKYNFDLVPLTMRRFMEGNHLPEGFFNDNVNKLRKDVLSFAQFIKDYNVRPLAIEISLVHPDRRYAGCLDMPCVMTIKGKDVTAIVDFKSGRKGFWEEHELQLHLYKEMWNYTFPDKPAERVFNFSPKDWRKAPTYNLKDQTGSKAIEKLPALLALARIEDESRPDGLSVIRGEIDLDNLDTSKVITEMTLAELVKLGENKPLDSADDDEPIKPLFADETLVKSKKTSK